MPYLCFNATRCNPLQPAAEIAAASKERAQLERKKTDLEVEKKKLGNK